MKIKDRFNFAGGKQKTVIRAEVPTVHGDDKHVVLRIYDPIDSFGDMWGISAREFGAALDALPDGVEHIELHINSPGGEVHEGLAILNQIRQHPARVTVIIDGLAASAASFIAMGADEVLMAPNAEMMIHNAWGAAFGDSVEMERMAADLNRLNSNLASIYQGKAGGVIDDWLEAMRVETWYSDREAVAAGLADGILAAPDADEAVRARFDLRVFAHAGRAAAPAPYIPRAIDMGAGRGPAGPVNVEKKGTDNMSELIDGLRERLGIPDDAELDTKQLLDAVDEALEERAEPSDLVTCSRELPEGTEIVDSSVLAQLRADAEDGRLARAEQVKARREKIVEDAIKAGKFGPARRDAWLNALEIDEAGALSDLEQLSPGLIPVKQIGNAGETADGDEALYNRAWGARKEN